MLPAVLLSALLLTSGGSPASALPDEKAVKPVEVVVVPEYSEGIVFDHAGNAYISHGDTITKITPAGKPSTWAKTPAPNGHKILADGTHLVCDGNAHAILHLDADGKQLEPASKECGGKPLRAPNDLSLDTAHGGFYFTDPANSDNKNPNGSVYYVDSRGTTHLIAEGLAYPNGIVLRPDGKTLLVGESAKNRVLAYPVLGPGRLGAMSVLAELPAKAGDQVDNQPDGMCLDTAGNLYVAHYGMHQVQVLSPEGKLLRRYPAGTLTTSNVAFGGPKMDQLYITGGLGKEPGSKGALFRLDLPGVQGLVILPKKE
jgi:gluconolactonase